MLRDGLLTLCPYNIILFTSVKHLFIFTLGNYPLDIICPSFIFLTTDLPVNKVYIPAIKKNIVANTFGSNKDTHEKSLVAITFWRQKEPIEKNTMVPVFIIDTVSNSGSLTL